MKRFISGIGLLALLCSVCFGQGVYFSSASNYKPRKKDLKDIPEPTLIASSRVVGLAEPLQINDSLNIIYIQDFVNDVKDIDSVTADKVFEVKLARDKKTVTLESKGFFPPIYSDLKIWYEDVYYSIPLIRSINRPKKFQLFHTGKSYKRVSIAGSFNNWNPGTHVMAFDTIDSSWTTQLDLPPGTYEYQFVADGSWLRDSLCPDSADNGNGGWNSSVEVGNPSGEGRPNIRPVKVSGRTIHLKSDVKLSGAMVFWNNVRLNLDYYKIKKDKIMITIPRTSEEMERSDIRVWAYTDDMMSNNVQIPLFYGEVALHTTRIDRYDKHGNIMYFMLVDRFNDGEKRNNWPVEDKEVDERANFQGGDLQGIIDKINDDYLPLLGVNTLWLSPIVKNPDKAYREYPEPHRKYSGYHGYWPVESNMIDRRFGGDDELHELVKVAHENNMNVILDFVSNHVHEDHPKIKQHPDWATDMKLENGQKNIRLWDEQRLTTWFDTFLPSLDFTKKEVASFQINNALYWLKSFNVDGFRHDATKHIPTQFWKDLTREIKQHIEVPQDHSVIQIGETFGNRDLINSYVGTDKLDGQFDFNLYFDAREVFAKENESFERLINSLNESFTYYGHHHLMGNITGNHDLPRFISYAGGGLKWDEDEKEAGWNRDIQVDDPDGYKKLSMLTAFMMTIPGVPVLYYGDEIGIAGAGDPDNRRMMRFDSLSVEEEFVYDNARKLCNLRKNQMALVYGQFMPIEVTENTLIYARVFFDNLVVVAMNKGMGGRNFRVELPKEFRKIDLKPTFGHKTTRKKDTLEFLLKGFDYEIFVVPLKYK